MITSGFFLWYSRFTLFSHGSQQQYKSTLCRLFAGCDMSETSSASAKPTKNFFVEMLTRDISLEDAILDLLDNCVDGVQRSAEGVDSDQPYSGYWAEISFSNEGFKIEDNCGGIPIHIARKYAFRLGRPPEMDDEDRNKFTIGTYGIGMKRAIFKMGMDATVCAQTKEDSFSVAITSDWMKDEDDWTLPLEETGRSLDIEGTQITIRQLRPGIEEMCREGNKSKLHSAIIGQIRYQYSYILSKGFAVRVNGYSVTPAPLELKWGSPVNTSFAIEPYLYEATIDEVEINLAVGFYRPTPTQEEIDAETIVDRAEANRLRRGSKDIAGWTIICNDRVVVYADRTLLTGWGGDGLPKYHPQFISIAGIVHFRCEDAKKLPVNTTKRGIDASSLIYLYVKSNFMTKGLKIFTSYTNKWKGYTQEEHEISDNTPVLVPQKIAAQIPKENWKDVRRRFSSSEKKDIEQSQRQFVPTRLPEPKRDQADSKVRISYSKEIDEVELVADYLLGECEVKPSKVGEVCFDHILGKAKR
ncbi:MAG: ATP-binding protein [Cyanothece sp. SIO2G6]|nr:ATP-binding protein [Cyanothece sp. SIO2G6]